MGSYTIFSRFKPLEDFNTQVLQEIIPQPSSKIAQIQNKARMTYKSVLKDMQVMIYCTRKEIRAFKPRTYR